MIVISIIRLTKLSHEYSGHLAIADILIPRTKIILYNTFVNGHLAKATEGQFILLRKQFSHV